MFAVLKTGGKQYKVQSGDMLRVEKLAADAGEKVQFNEILMLGGDAPVIGDPHLAPERVERLERQEEIENHVAQKDDVQQTVHDEPWV